MNLYKCDHCTKKTGENAGYFSKETAPVVLCPVCGDKAKLVQRDINTMHWVYADAVNGKLVGPDGRRWVLGCDPTASGLLVNYTHSDNPAATVCAGCKANEVYVVRTGGTK